LALSTALLLLLSLIWGASFLFIKIGVSQIGPMTFAWLRVVIGALVLYVVTRVRRTSPPLTWRIWCRFGIVGFFGILVPFSAIAWGSQYIESGLAAILNASTPLFTMVLVTLLGEQKLVAHRVLGVLVGLGGILLLTWTELHQEHSASLWGELAIVLASLSYGIAIVVAGRYFKDRSPLTISLGQVSWGALLLTPAALWERPWTQSFTLPVVVSLLAIGILGTGVAYLLYFGLLKREGAVFTSLVTYIVPVFGVFWGWLVLGERLPWRAFVALAIILCGVALVGQLTLRISRRLRSRPAKGA